MNVVAYTFEMLGIIHLGSRNITLYTHQAVLQVLEPGQTSIDSWLEDISKKYIPEGGAEEVKRCFGLNNMLARLEERPGDMILSFPVWRRIRGGISRLIYSGGQGP